MCPLMVKSDLMRAPTSSTKGSNLGSQFVYDSELAVSVTDEQESHLMVLGSLKIAIYLSQ